MGLREAQVVELQSVCHLICHQTHRSTMRGQQKSAIGNTLGTGRDTTASSGSQPFHTEMASSVASSEPSRPRQRHWPHEARDCLGLRRGFQIQRFVRFDHVLCLPSKCCPVVCFCSSPCSRPFASGVHTRLGFRMSSRGLERSFPWRRSAAPPRPMRSGLPRSCRHQQS